MTASPAGVQLAVGSAFDAGARVGYGAFGDASTAAAPSDPAGAVGGTADDPSSVLAPGRPWAFVPQATSPPIIGQGRLVVLDPGHGGSDSGAEHNGLVEKTLTLDIAERVRPILAARGFAVKMTRDRDVDVYAPNDSAHDELQARSDVANAARAAMFVSIHINSSVSSGPNGTTTFFYKPQDYGLAAAIERRLVPALGTANDGVQKANFYVMHHTTMPATLIETAFLSNSSDAALLRSPDFRQRVAMAIADGIGDYAAHPEATSHADVGSNDAQ